MCGKVSHAVRAVEAGCDVVVAQGTEAGGHTGQVATMALVPQVVDAVGSEVPVVAAGGLFDGRGLAAALALGADGIWVGTRFIATPEARAVAGYKDRLLASAEDATTITRAYTGKTCRVIRNGYTDEFAASGGTPEPFPGQVLKSMGEVLKKHKPPVARKSSFSLASSAMAIFSTLAASTSTADLLVSNTHSRRRSKAKGRMTRPYWL
jgi:enoyl-[acyl-carrier protein] reductase II